MSEHELNKPSKEKQIKSQQRVADFGEVFTASREVEAMLDLVKDESERIESRFLEPACGDGNFLVAIFERKLNTLAKRYRSKKEDFEINLLMAVGSIYAIDLLPDNVKAAQERLFEMAVQVYRKILHQEPDSTYQDIIRLILARNIICGDSLNGIDKIIFTEWSSLGYQIKRAEYSFAQMNTESEIASLPLFSMELNENKEPVFFPNPIKTYPLTYYRNLLEVK